MKNTQPKVINYHEDKWEFVYPEEMDSEDVQDEYWGAAELLDYRDEIAEAVFKKLINRFPFFIDAYNHLSLAFRNQRKYFESYLTAEKAYHLATSLLPGEFKIGRDKLIWSNIDNRPFLRSYQIYGLECQYRKDYSKAMDLYKKILLLNEGDNQGARYLYLECLFAIKDYQTARKLLSKYPDDWSIEFLYGKVAVEILAGKMDKAKQRIKHAVERNVHLPREVVKAKHKPPPPFKMPGQPALDGGIHVGSIQEAYEYWERNKSLYKLKAIIDFYKELNSQS